MAEENAGINVQVLRDRGLNCKRLRKLEDQQRAEMNNSNKNAQDFRRFGFLSGAETQEKVAKVQGEMAEKLNTLRRQVCGLK